MTVKKAYSICDIEKRDFKTISLSGEWKRHLGQIEQSGSILIMGDSGHGKTSYAMQMAKAFCQQEKVFYNSAEEGIRQSFKRSLSINNMKSVAANFTFSKEDYDTMVARLTKKRQPKIVIIDSIQYCFRGKRKNAYYDLIERFPNTLFIGLSHVKKGMPTGAIANEFYWDCQSRTIVKDFKAYTDKSRCGGDEKTPYIISQVKADERQVKLLKKG